jgi:hypothetical protein
MCKYFFAHIGGEAFQALYSFLPRLHPCSTRPNHFYERRCYMYEYILHPRNTA